MDKLAEEVAKIVKVKRLRANPMMDEVAVKLNSQPTYEEIQVAQVYVDAVREVAADD